MKQTSEAFERRVQEILDEDPKKRHERVQRMLAERIAFHEAKAAEARRRAKRRSSVE